MAIQYPRAELISHLVLTSYADHPLHALNIFLSGFVTLMKRRPNFNILISPAL
jgi:hypothetical protein